MWLSLVFLSHQLLHLSLGGQGSSPSHVEDVHARLIPTRLHPPCPIPPIPSFPARSRTHRTCYSHPSPSGAFLTSVPRLRSVNSCGSLPQTRTNQTEVNLETEEGIRTPRSSPLIALVRVNSCLRSSSQASSCVSTPSPPRFFEVKRARV